MGDCTYMYILHMPAKGFVILQTLFSPRFAVAAGAAPARRSESDLAPQGSLVSPSLCAVGLVAPCTIQEGSLRLLPH